MKIALEEGVRIFITSAGTPKKFTAYLKSQGASVLHVVSHPEHARKCEDAGVDMVIAEGFEAGGHNGKDELTTLVLIPQVVDAVKIPVIAAGGISCGRSLAAAFCLGAQGAQIGSRFVTAQESSAHLNFKNKILNSAFGSTKLLMKKYIPVRLMENEFSAKIQEMENAGATSEELAAFLGKGRAKLGMFEGEISQGELEIGQVAGTFKNIQPMQEIVEEIMQQAHEIKNLSVFL